MNANPGMQFTFPRAFDEPVSNGRYCVAALARLPDWRISYTPKRFLNEPCHRPAVGSARCSTYTACASKVTLKVSREPDVGVQHEHLGRHSLPTLHTATARRVNPRLQVAQTESTCIDLSPADRHHSLNVSAIARVSGLIDAPATRAPIPVHGLPCPSQNRLNLCGSAEKAS